MNYIQKTIVLILSCYYFTTSVYAEELFVGDNSDYTTINAALEVARDGDVVTVNPGRYEETIETQQPGITLRAAEGGEVLVTQSGYLMRIQHERITVEGLTFDGQYSDRDGLQVRGEAHELTLRNVEVRHVSNDCIDLSSQNNVTIEDSLIHHCLLSTQADCSEPDCQRDAHGIVAAAARNLTVRNTEIHTISGDAIQLDPNRSNPGWSGLHIEGCRIWTGPLAEAVGGFTAGIIPGENALDTKTSNDVIEAAEITIIDTHVWGFRDGLISNMSAFNLKENVQVHLDRVTVNDSEIAFRIRGRTASRPRGAQVSMSNSVIYDVDTAIRYEDGVEEIHMNNITLGGTIGRFFQDVSESGHIEGRNVLVLTDILPNQLTDGSNLAVDTDCFTLTDPNDYHLAEGCAAIDVGETLNDYLADRDGVRRPQGAGWDIGAYEFCADDCDELQADGGIRPDIADLDMFEPSDMSINSEQDIMLNEIDNEIASNDMGTMLDRGATTNMGLMNRDLDITPDRSSMTDDDDHTSNENTGCQQSSYGTGVFSFILFILLLLLQGAMKVPSPKFTPTVTHQTLRPSRSSMVRPSGSVRVRLSPW